MRNFHLFLLALLFFGGFRVSAYEINLKPWIDADGLVWNRQLGFFSYETASQTCQSLKSRLPSPEEIKRAELSGLRKLPDMRSFFWTSKISHRDGVFATSYDPMIFSEKPGFFDESARDNKLSVFCVSGNSNNKEPIPDTDLDTCDFQQSRNQPLGYQCRTSVGVVFTRVTQENFGEAWQGGGLVWSDNLEVAEHGRAHEICKNIGARLPSQEDFQKGEASEFREVLPNQGYTWTSTEVDAEYARGVYSKLAPLVFTYFGEFAEYDSGIKFGVRCVIDTKQAFH